MDTILHHPDGDNLECGGTGVGCVFLWSSEGESGGGAGFRPSTDSGLCSWSEVSCKIANAMFGGWACEAFRPLASILPKPRVFPTGLRDVLRSDCWVWCDLYSGRLVDAQWTPQWTLSGRDSGLYKNTHVAKMCENERFLF